MLVLDAPEYENAVKQYELSLRDSNMLSCVQLAHLKDSYDSIDLSSNFITELDLSIFPRLSRLKTLLIAKNRVSRIGYDENVVVFPNLTTLSLAHNFINDLSCLSFLSSLPKLTYLSLVGNPVTSLPDYRMAVIRLQPSIRILDFQRVTAKERDEACNFNKLSEEGDKRRAELLHLLDNASSLEEVDRIETELNALK